MAQLRKFQLYEPKYFGGEVNDVFFASMWEMKPELMTKVIQEVVSTNVNSFSSYLKGLSTVKIKDHQEEYYWEIMGSTYINVPLIGARIGNSAVTSGTANVGAGGIKFQLIFPFRWFNKEEIVVGEKNEMYRIKIIDEPEYEGTNVVYTCTVMGENHTYGIPGAELVAGKKFSYEYYPIEVEDHRPGGGIRVSGTAAIKNQISSIRKDYSVYGREFGRKLITPIALKDNAGKVQKFNMSMPMVQWKFEKEFEQEFNRMLIYGRSNRDEAGNYHDRGQSGNIVRTGAGLFEQKDVGNFIIYDTFNLKLIEDALYNLSVNTLSLDQRVFTLRTGERGAAQFSNAASEKLSTWAFAGAAISAQNPSTIQKVSSPLHQNAFAIGAQIVEYRGGNNVVLRLDVDPSYDDDVRHKILKGNNELNGPAFSYRYDIEWIGGKDEPNIQLVEVEGWEMGDYSHYGSGFRNPWTGQHGPGANGNDKYGYGRVRKGGICVKDPSKVITLLPVELAYV